MLSRVEQANSVAVLEDDDVPAVMKKPAARGGRGRGRGGRGRGPGRGKKSAEDLEPVTPGPKPKPKQEPAVAVDLETPPKKTPKAKAKAKAKGKCSKGKPSPKTSPAKSSPSSAKKTKQSPTPKKGSKGPKKRQRHSDEDKSFARRAKPSSEEGCIRWTAIRDAYNEFLHSHFGASRQDGPPIHVCMHAWGLHVVNVMAACMQANFWQHVKPLMPQKASPQEYEKITKQAAREYLASAPEEPAGE